MSKIARYYACRAKHHVLPQNQMAYHTRWLRLHSDARHDTTHSCHHSGMRAQNPNSHLLDDMTTALPFILLLQPLVIKDLNLESSVARKTPWPRNFEDFKRFKAWCMLGRQKLRYYSRRYPDRH